MRRVYKEQEGRNEGRGNGSQRRGIGEGGGAFRRSEKKKRNEVHETQRGMRCEETKKSEFHGEIERWR